MQENFVCSVNAKEIKKEIHITDVQQNVLGSTNAVAAKELFDGLIMIRKLSDVDYLIQHKEESALATSLKVADLDNLELFEDGSTFRINFGSALSEEDFMTFSIEDFEDYSIFNEAVLECRMLSEITLRLGALARDVYFAGVYSSQLVENDSILLSEELHRMRQQQSSSAFNIFQLSSDRLEGQETDDESENDLHDVSKIPTAVQQHNISDMKCVFCGVQKMMEMSKDFAVHPYVPLTFDKKNIYMCIPCLENWRQYRKKATVENLLVLEDEVNEELCGE